MSLKPLMFTVGLIDRVTGPAQSVQSSFSDIIDTARSGFIDIGVGVAGIAGTGMALQSLVQPAIEMEKALGTLASLDLPEDQLRNLGQDAIKLSTELGISASDITRSAYAIQSAMGVDLTGNELSEFTRASSILAKATLSDSETITNYMATMYGVFNKSATEMGRSEWVNQMTGMTAEAVKMFRTSGSEMASAFANLTSSATDFGVSMSEQMAILGTLQNVIPSGSEAATAYRGFLAGAQKAQGSLGVQLFADADLTELLPIQDILSNLEDVGTMDLTSAFGSQEAVKFLSILQNNIGSLNSGLDNLGNTDNMEEALKMARTNTDPWDRLASSLDAVRIGFGSGLLPILTPLVNRLTDVAVIIYDFTELFPNITRYVGIATSIIFGFVGALSALTVITGLATLVTKGWAIGAKIVTKITKIWAAIQWTLNFALAAMASPIGLIVIGLTALAAVGYAVWLGIKALWDLFKDSAAAEYLMGMIEGVVNWFKSLGGVIDWAIEKINLIPGIEIGTETDDIPGTEAPVTPQLTETIPDLGTSVLPVSTSLSEQELLPAQTFDMTPLTPVALNNPALESQTPTPSVPEMVEPVMNVDSMKVEIPYLKEGTNSEVPSGGITNQISKSINDNSSRSNQITINSSSPFTAAHLNEYLLMEGG